MIGLKCLNYVLDTEPVIKKILISNNFNYGREGEIDLDTWVEVFISDMYRFRVFTDMLLGWKKNIPPREIVEDFVSYKIDIFSFLIYDLLNFYGEDTKIMDSELVETIKLLLSFGLKLKKSHIGILEYNKKKIEDLLKII
jgi:hypothetical protein